MRPGLRAFALAAVLFGSALCGSACEPAPPVTTDVDGPRLVVTDARLDAGNGMVIHAAAATIDDEGAGVGQQVHAVLPPQAADQSGGGSAGGSSGTASSRPNLEITAPSSDWDLRTRTVNFTGGVTAIRGEVTLTCRDLQVRYADADKIDTATATGDVVVLRSGRRATGDQAILTSSTGKLTLTGSPRVTEGPNTLTGSRITLFLDDERVVCDDCRLVVSGSALGPQ